MSPSGFGIQLVLATFAVGGAIFVRLFQSLYSFCQSRFIKFQNRLSKANVAEEFLEFN